MEKNSRSADLRKEIPFKQALLVAVAAGLGYGFDSYAVNIYSLVLPAIKDTLQISLSALGAISSIFLVGYTIGTIGFGIAADKWGRKDTLGVAILLYGLTTMLGGLTKNIALFTGLRFLTGVGGAGELAVGAPYTAEMWPPKYRAIGTGGIIFSLYSLGYVLAAGTALVVVPRWGWQLAFILAIVPAVVVFLVLRRLRESTRFTMAKLETRSKQRAGVAKPKVWQIPGGKKRISIGWLIYTANAVGYWGMTVFLTTFMVEKFHLSSTSAIEFALLFFVGQFFFSYLGTWLADVIGRRPSAIGAAIIMMVATALGASATSLTTYLVFGGLSIAMLGWLWGVGDTYISELFPTVLRGTGFGIAVGGGRVVSIAAPFAVGWATSTYGPTLPYAAFTGLWILTIIGYALGPETARKELEEISSEALGEHARHPQSAGAGPIVDP